MVLGIYMIENIINRKMYIGSSENITRRKNNHFSALRRNKHDNPLLQRSWNKYGTEAFKFILLEKIEQVEHLLEAEQKWLDKFWDNQKKCYNLAKKAHSVMGGRKHSKESKNKIIKALIGRNNVAIEQFDKNSNLLNSFKSLKEACEKTGLKSTNITECLRERNKSAGGYIWKYKRIDINA